MQKSTPKIKPNEDLLFAGNSIFKHSSVALKSMPQHKLLTPGQRLCLQTEGEYYLLFLLEGELTIRLNAEETGATSYRPRQMVFIPMGTLVEIEATTKASLLTFLFLPSIHLCGGRCPEQKQEHFQVTSHGEEEKHLQCLPFSHGVDLWTAMILEYTKYVLSDLRLFDIKLQELFLLLRMNYARQTVDTFLKHYHCRHMGFRKEVFRHHLQSKNAEDLAKKLGVTPLALTRLFDEEFGMPPLKWMLQQRARHVYKDLVDSRLSLTEITEKYYFSSAGYLSAFCRRMFGKSPLKIRKGSKLTLDDSDED